MDLREIHSVGADTRERMVGPQACPALARHDIRLAGISDAQIGFQFVRLKPDIAQLLVCVAGRGEVWLDGRWHACDPGEAYVTPAFAAHAYRALKESSWRVGWVMYGVRATAISGPKPLLVKCDPQPLATVIEGLYRESVGAANPAVMDQWAELVQAYALRAIGTASLDAWLWRLWEAVDADLAAPWTLSELARRTGLSGEHLRRICRQRLGRSPMRHVTYLRVRRAAALLTSQPSSVEEVARQVGYQNAFAFSTAFKRVMRLSPSVYRARALRR